jgi:parallel beta-helix repeat protein
MAIVYCSWATGDDTTGTGTAANPYKTITKASTSRSAGDEVRVAKSPDPTALTGTTAWTLNGTTVTGTNTLFTSELAIGDFISAPDGNWYEIITLTSNTSAKLKTKYPSASASGHSSQKLGVTDTGEAASGTTQVQVVNSSGNSSAFLYISGGWDLFTETQTGQTWFRQMHGTFNNRNGYGLYMTRKSYTNLDKLNFLRYYYGIYYTNSSNNTITSATCNSNGNSGIYYTSSSSNNTITSATCNSNSQYGIYYYTSCNNNTIASATCNSNGTGIYYSGSSNNTITSATCNSNTTGISYYTSCNNNTIASATCNSNSNYGIYYNTSSNNTIYALSTTGNTTAGIYSDNSNNICHSATIAESKKVATGTAYYSDTRQYINNLGGFSYVYSNYATANSQNASAGGTGKEWKFAITNAARNTVYPFYIPLARVAVASSGKVTVKVYFKKSGTGIAGALRCRYGQITWSDAAQDIIVTCPDNTSRNQVTLEFTPTEAGVVEIEAGAWYVSSTSQTVIIDDIEITQA